MAKDKNIFDLDALQSKAPTVSFEYEGQTVSLTLDGAADPRPAGPAEPALIAWLAEAIEEWNIGKGKRILPVKRRTIRQLPKRLRDRIATEVMGALSPVEQEEPHDESDS